MTPSKDGGANEGHSCVKGRFAFGYASHPDRVLTPLMRESITDEWREASWDEAISFVARRFKEIQAEHGQGAIGGITSSRTTNEEVYAVQRMVRGAFGNNNVDTCARVCHSPTGYGLKQTFGTSAGTQDFKSVDECDVMVVIGANPTDGHPVFASRMKRRLREGAKLIVIDPRRIDLVRTPHVAGAAPPPARSPAPTWPSSTRSPTSWSPRASRPRTSSPSRTRGLRRVGRVRGPAGEQPRVARGRLRRTGPGRPRRRPDVRRGPQLGDLLRPRRHRAQPGLDDGHGHGEPRDGHRQHRPPRCRRQPAAGPEQRAGLLRHGVLPARAARLPPRLRPDGARDLRAALGDHDPRGAGPADPEHVRLRPRRHLPGDVRAGRGHGAVRPEHRPRARRPRVARPPRRPGPVPQRDREVRARAAARARRSSRRTAPSPTPSGASTACAR